MSESKAFYFRFSSRDTALDKLGFDRCWQSAIAWGCQEEDIYWDFDSGANPERTDYQKLIDAIKQNKYTDIGTPNQSRIHRDSVESQLFGRLLREKKIKLHLLESRGELNLETSEARRQYGLDGLFSEWEYEKIQERNLRNWEDIRKNTISVKTPFGYVTGSNRKPEIDYTPTVCLLETKEIVSYADILLEIIDLAFELGSINKIVKVINKKYGIYRFDTTNLTDNKSKNVKKKKLNPYINNPHIHRKPLYFCHSTIHNLLTNEILIGTLVYLKGTDREEKIENNHPALITQEKFNRLGKLISGKANPIISKGSKARYPLTGLVYCGLCGGTCYSANCGGKTKRYYYYFKCKNLRSNCPSKSIRSELCEAAVNAELVKRYEQIRTLAIKPEEKIVNPKVVALENQLQGLMSLPIQDNNIQATIENTKREIEQLNSNIEIDSEVNQSRIDLLDSTFQNPLYWETLEQASKREIYHTLIKRVVINVDIIDKADPNYKSRKSYVERVDLLV